MKHSQDHHGFNRVCAARKVASLLSWRSLRELPWVFRVALLLIGVATVTCVIIFALLPLLAIATAMFN